MWTTISLSSIVKKWKNDNEQHSLLVHAVPVHAAVPETDIVADADSYTMDEVNSRAHTTRTCSHDMVMRGNENGVSLISDRFPTSPHGFNGVKDWKIVAYAQGWKIYCRHLIFNFAAYAR
jgi:hypothetical protein